MLHVSEGLGGSELRTLRNLSDLISDRMFTVGAQYYCDVWRTGTEVIFSVFPGDVSRVKAHENEFCELVRKAAEIAGFLRPVCAVWGVMRYE